MYTDPIDSSLQIGGGDIIDITWSIDDGSLVRNFPHDPYDQRFQMMTVIPKNDLTSPPNYCRKLSGEWTGQ